MKASCVAAILTLTLPSVAAAQVKEVDARTADGACALLFVKIEQSAQARKWPATPQDEREITTLLSNCAWSATMCEDAREAMSEKLTGIDVKGAQLTCRTRGSATPKQDVKADADSACTLLSVFVRQALTAKRWPGTSEDERRLPSVLSACSTSSNCEDTRQDMIEDLKSIGANAPQLSCRSGRK